MWVCGLTEKTGEQRHEGDTDEGNAAACHELLHTLGLCAGVIVAVAFEQVDYTPNAKTGTESDNEGLENTNSRVKKFHRLNVAERKECKAQTTDFAVQHSFQKFLFFIDFGSGHSVLGIIKTALWRFRTHRRRPPQRLGKLHPVLF